MAREILEAGKIADEILKDNPDMERLEAIMIAYKIQGAKKK